LLYQYSVAQDRCGKALKIALPPHLMRHPDFEISQDCSGNCHGDSYEKCAFFQIPARVSGFDIVLASLWVTDHRDFTHQRLRHQHSVIRLRQYTGHPEYRHYKFRERYTVHTDTEHHP